MRDTLLSSVAMSCKLGLLSSLLFFLTAGVGVWAAYDKTGALLKLSLILTGLILALGLAWYSKARPETVLILAGLTSSAAVAALSLMLVFFHPASGPTANALVILLPMALGAMLWTVCVRSRLLMLLSSGSSILGFLSLILTRERTPWLALGVGLLSTAMIHWRHIRRQRRLARWVFDGALAILALCVLGYIAMLGMSTSKVCLETLPLSPLVKRLHLWHDSITLIQDYPFTGSGLGSTAMAFSSYVLLLHVPFQNQAHNLFLQIATEQGVPGLMIFLTMVVASSWALLQALRNRNTLAYSAGLVTSAALIGLLVCGMFDSEIYVSGLVPILFVPFGCAWCVGTAALNDFPRSVTRFPRLRRKLTIASTFLLLFGSAFSLRPVVRAQFSANLGAVSQAQAELSVYSWPRWGLQDEVRRNGAADLSQALVAYHSALKLDPLNVTANRRLGQIELAQGNIQSAQQHLEMAYAIAPDQRATRQLLGEIYAISGRSEKAVDLWQRIDVSHRQLEVRQWWYENIHAKQESAQLTRAIALLTQDGL